MKWLDILKIVLAAVAAAVGAIAGIQAEKPAVAALLAPRPVVAVYTQSASSPRLLPRSK